MLEKEIDVVFDQGLFLCGACRTSLNKHIMNGYTTKAFETKYSFSKYTLAPLYCPSCLCRLRWEDAINNAAEYIPLVHIGGISEEELCTEYSTDTGIAIKGEL